MKNKEKDLISKEEKLNTRERLEKDLRETRSELANRIRRKIFGS